MECKNHGGVVAVAPCTYCGSHYCSSCLIELAGRTTCETCKPLALRAATSQGAPRGDANSALKYVVPIGGNVYALLARWVALFALVFFPLGVLGGPIAIVLGVAGMKRADALGDGKVASVFATILGTIALVASGAFWVVAGTRF